MPNVRRGRWRSKKIHIWVEPVKLDRLDTLAERRDITRPAAFEHAMDLAIRDFEKKERV